MTDFNVGPGIQAALDDHGDTARSDELYIVNTEGVKVSQVFGDQGVYYWMQEVNAVRRTPFPG